MVTSSKRICYLDALRGVAILLMVMRHVLSDTYGDWNYLLDKWCTMSDSLVYSSVLWKFIYSFHMPLLFFISGYLFYKPRSYDAKSCYDSIRKRLVRLMVPYVATGFLLYLYKGVFGYWFLCVLFVTNVIVTLCLLFLDHFKLDRMRWNILTLGVVYLVLIVYRTTVDFMPDYTFQMVTCYPAFALGLLLRKYPRLIAVACNKYLCLVYLVIYVSAFVYLNYHSFGERYIEPVMILSIVLFFFVSFRKVSDTEWNSTEGRFLMEVGKYSMEIYILHIFFIIKIQAVGDYILTLADFPTSIALQVAYSLVLSFVAIKLSLFVSKFLSGSELFNKLFFGK